MERISINKKLRCVRVWEGGRGGKQTYFTVKKYGSWDKAYRAAVAYEKTLPDYIRAGRKKPREKAYSHSQTNVVGVCPIFNKYGEHDGYRSQWVEYDRNGNPKYRQQGFYFGAWGSIAFDMAKKKRREMVSIVGRK